MLIAYWQQLKTALNCKPYLSAHGFSFIEGHFAGILDGIKSSCPSILSYVAVRSCFYFFIMSSAMIEGTNIGFYPCYIRLAFRYKISNNGSKKSRSEIDPAPLIGGTNDNEI